MRDDSLRVRPAATREAVVLAAKAHGRRKLRRRRSTCDLRGDTTTCDAPTRPCGQTATDDARSQRPSASCRVPGRWPGRARQGRRAGAPRMGSRVPAGDPEFGAAPTRVSLSCSMPFTSSAAVQAKTRPTPRRRESTRARDSVGCSLRHPSRAHAHARVRRRCGTPKPPRSRVPPRRTRGA
jgi:hypothetical protein